MKNWETPDVEVVEIKATEHGWAGWYRDGGYIGDGEINLHLTWDKPEEPAPTPTSTPTPIPTNTPEGQHS